MTEHDRRLIIETLEQGARERGRTDFAVAHVATEGFRGSSSFAVDRLMVTLKSGDVVSVYFKNLHPDHLLAEAKAVRSGDLVRSNRELWAYRKVLSQLELGTPELLGVRWEPDQRRCWMFLEDVGPKRLSRLADFNRWCAAAGWLAAFQAGTGALNPRCWQHLEPRVDGGADVLRTQLEAKLGSFQAEQVGVIRSGLDALASLRSVLDQLPTSVVHGEYFGKNVVIRDGGSPGPIAVIDWETIAHGPADWDLASISAGRWTPHQRMQMWRTYFEAAREQGLRREWSRFVEEARATALLHALWWLSFWSGQDEVHKDRWTREVAASLELLNDKAA